MHTPLESELSILRDQGLTRQRRVVDSSCSRLVTVESKTCLNFASNDYLGLANHPALIKAMAAGAEIWGTGAGASHLVSGHMAAHETLEVALAQFIGFPRALTFSTGYLANLAVTPTLAGRGDAVFADKLNHASLIDGMQLAKAQGASVYRYPHLELSRLRALLSASTAHRKLIVTDAVFSMDGDIAPLPELLALADQFNAWLLVDDAHGFGVLGPQGQGTVAHFGNHTALTAHPRLVWMATLGKAAGVSGAFIAGSETLIEYLIQKSRAYIFTTAAPPAMACALQESLRLIQAGDDRRAQLQARIAQLQAGLSHLPWKALPSQTAIQPLIVGSNAAALALSRSLWDQGIWAPAIRPPTVPKGTARLRLSLSATHTAEDIEGLLSALRSLA